MYEKSLTHTASGKVSTVSGVERKKRLREKKITHTNASFEPKKKLLFFKCWALCAIIQLEGMGREERRKCCLRHLCISLGIKTKSR
jgi:hypothetical protein